ncbi:R-spondin-2 isoform X2 [Aplysia californica]|uniref:R-spondin-2 isoform X2 n=1 Tax=Aplysia californica TaxID=6500 RepID=A0ABM0ZXA4_APLCA|nr:R-spondin-2 isoform X2 [Aplysia californica]
MLWLTFLVYHLILCEYLFRAVKASGRVKRTIIGRYPVCPRGCTACSRVNGCVTCEARLFMFLYRQNMREIGICTPSCPVGYYGVRHQYYSKCYKCHIDHCHSCFSRHFCTLCEEPYLASEGQCIEECPRGLYYANFTRECKEKVDCLPGAWSPWSVCTRNGQTCGYKWGVQTRTRQILQDASPNGAQCPEVTGTQRCRLQQRHCDEAHSGGVLPARTSYVIRGTRYPLQLYCFAISFFVCCLLLRFCNVFKS